ncbi:MAG TPA: SBBP repeat-containing protein, partial [Chitinophagaceae bacterium]|nr:SBBP repeat-containing protein [Chitinophagaceae bacterium]
QNSIIKLTDMKKSHILFSTLFSLLTFSNAFGQTPDWAVRYNGPANKFDGTRAMTIDADGNIYVTGPSDGKKGNSDYATVKYDPSGEQKWVARYNGTGNADDYPYAIAVDGSGNVYVTGRSMGAGGNYDYATVKYNSLGGQEWVAPYNGQTNQIDMAKDVQVDDLGNVYVTGLADGANTVYGSAYATIKYNSSGTQEWARRYDGTTGSEDANSLAIDAAGSVYVTGRSNGITTVKYDNDGVQQWVRTNAGTNGQKVLVDNLGNIVVTGWGSVTAKYNPSGELLWETIYPYDAAFRDMALDNAGNVYVVGYNRENGTSDDYRTVKYDANGAQQWSRGFNGSANGIDLARAIALDGNGNVYITGQCVLKEGRNTNENYATVKYNNVGDVQWVRYYDGPEKSVDRGFDITVDGSGNVYVSGESAAKTSYFDFATIKYSEGAATRSAITNPMAETSNIFQLRSFPNPFTRSTTIQYNLLKEARVTLGVYDLLGQRVASLVNETKAAGTHQVSFSTDHLPSGTYLCRFESGSFSRTEKLILLK